MWRAALLAAALATAPTLRMTENGVETKAGDGIVTFNQSLPGVHTFKLSADGKVVSIQALFGGRVEPTTQIWPDEKPAGSFRR